MSIGKKIRFIRLQKKISRDELAKSTGITYHALSKYETDQRTPDPETLKKICNSLCISLDDLFDSPVRTNLNKRDIETFLEQGQVWFRDMLLNESEVLMLLNSLEAIYIRAKK